MHLFFPRDEDPNASQFQPLVYFPGNGVIGMSRFDQTGRWADLAIATGLVQTGRVVCWPIYKGTLERTDGFDHAMRPMRHREFFMQQVKDLRRAVDYLEKRPELDLNGLAFVGWSRGAGLGPLFTVLEHRFKACIYMSGGLWGAPLPEMDARKYAPMSTFRRS